MKTIARSLLVTLALSSAAVLPAQEAWEKDYNALLQKYVTPEGVKYAAWHGNAADKARLGKVVKGIGDASLEGLDENTRLAFYLNAYNAWILERILADYPTDGPGGGGLFGRNRFFKAKNIKVAGATTSFSDLENELIRPTFEEPRIHFALNCASLSCPPLHTKAFTGATLDATLDKLTKAFVNDNPSGVKLEGGKAHLSKIFDWYEDDFEEAGGALAYVNQYRTSPIAKGTKVTFQDYHWTLNATK